MSMIDTLLARPLRLAFIVIVMLVTASLTLAIVPEDKQALVVRYGQIVYKINEPKAGESFGNSGAGLIARIPFIDSIVTFDKKIIGANIINQRVNTTDQYSLEVDAFVRFRIVKPTRTYKSLRSEANLKTRISSILASSLSEELGKRDMVSLLSAERSAVMSSIKKRLNASAVRYGAEIIDMQIKKAELVKGDPQDAAFARMISAFEKEAETMRNSGQNQAKIIRGNADAEAARIYAESFGKDPAFYDFFRAMQSYRQTFAAQTDSDEKTSIILSPNSEYLRQFRGD